MKKGWTRRYGFKLTAFILVGVLAVLLSMNRSQAAPSGKGVGSLEELKAAISDGVTEIYLTADISVSGYLNFSDDVSRRLDLNGHKIFLNSAGTKRSNLVIKSGTLTVCDGSSDKSGEIKGGYVIGGFGGGVRIDGATFNLEGGSINGCTACWGGGVAIINGGVFNMSGGAIEKNFIYGSAYKAFGGGVFVSDGTFNMSGGVIRGNQEVTASKNRGGGVAVMEGGTFVMTGGAIGDHTVLNGANSISGDGAGVYVKDGSFSLKGGTVENNYTTANGGGIYLDEGSKFEMTAPDALFYNHATNSGGAIYIKNASASISGTTIHDNRIGGDLGAAICIDKSQTATVTISDTVIEENISGESAGGIYVGGGGLGLTNVTIKNNIANTMNGGGIYVDDSAVLAMTGGSITGNTAKGGSLYGGAEPTGFGGAIYQQKNSTVRLTGVTISGNEANDGGAIYLNIDASCALTDVSITGNKANSYKIDSTYVGGAIRSEGSIKVGGTVVVKDNTHCSNIDGALVRGSNILLIEGSYIELSAPLEKDSQIGVWKEGSEKKITSNYGREDYATWRSRPDSFFFSDDETYFVQKNPKKQSDDPDYHEAYLQTPKHEHTLIKGDVIPSTCKSGGQREYYSCTDCGRLFADANGEKEIKKGEIALSVDPNNHTRITVETKVTKDPECMENGLLVVTAKCIGCGKVVSQSERVISALGHNFEPISQKEIDGVMTEGYGEKCTICNFEWFVPGAACAHDDNKFVEQIDPDCINSGRKAYAVCNICNSHYRLDENGDVTDKLLPQDEESLNKALFIPPLGHEVELIDPENVNSDVRWFFDEESVKEPTCTESGSHLEYTRCKRCQTVIDRKKIEDPALGHDWGEEYVENCTLKRKCLTCGTIETIGAHHNLLEVGAVEPECTSDGHEALYACVDCGHLFDHESFSSSGVQTEIAYSDVLIPALGHDFGEWEIVEEPTASVDGIEMRSCRRCGAMEIRDIVSDVRYTFTKGDGSEWVKGSSGTLDFTVKRSYRDELTFDTLFTGAVYIDGEKLSEDDFSASKGSVELKIRDSVLNKLTVGEHVLTVEFEDAEVSAKFKVTEPEASEEATVVPEKETVKPSDDNKTGKDEGSPKTGDDTPVAIFIILAAVSVIAIAACIVLKIRKNRKSSIEDSESKESRS